MHLPMLAAIHSAAVLGIEAYDVTVEVDAAQGLPQWTIVGLPAGAVKESRERVGAALVNSGFVVPPKRFTINLAPADRRKDGTAFDLPIALGILVATGQLRAETVAKHRRGGRARSRRDVARDARRAPDLAPGRAAHRRGRCAAHARAPAPERGRGGAGAGDGAGGAGDAARPRGRAAARWARARGARGWRARVRARVARLRGRRRPGNREARARDRGGRRTQRRDGRAAGRGEDDARATIAEHPSGAHGGGGARRHGDPLGGGRARAGRSACGRAPVSRAAPYDLGRGAHRRRESAASGRGEPRAPRNSLSRRAAGVSPARGGVAAPADGGWPRRDRARGARDRLSRRASRWWAR